MVAPLIRLLYQGNRLVIDPTTDRVKEVLIPALTAVEKRVVYGEELAVRERLVKNGDLAGPAHLAFRDLPLYYFELKKRLVTPRGMHAIVDSTLAQAGFKTSLINCEPQIERERRTRIYTPDFKKVFDYAELRYMQDEVLVRIASRFCGRIGCPPGYGKSFLMVLVCKLFPKAKIHIVARGHALLHQHFKSLMSAGVNPGMVGAGKQEWRYRVTVVSADSLHRSDGDCDILLGDECHELAAGKYCAHLARYSRSYNFGFSASQNQRSDGRDPIVEAIFGPLILNISYDKARNEGLVNDILVLWTPVRMKNNPAAVASGPVAGNSKKATVLRSVAKLRAAVWRNAYRNSLIAADARRYDAETQVLIVTDTIDHAVRLKKLLPEYTLVYGKAGMEGRKNAQETVRDFLIRKKFLAEDEPLMTAERALKLKRRFEAGKLKKVIATTVWNVGVDFRGLSVLVRADGGASAVRDTQIPGRTSRVMAGKSVSIVHDYMDEFDKGMKGRSLKRRRNYTKNGWQQKYAAAPTQKPLFE